MENKFKEKWEVADDCVCRMCELLGLSIVHGEVVEDGKVLRRDESCCYEFPEVITLPSGIKVDSLLFFGDGTFEIHEHDTTDAYCWVEYCIEDLTCIYKTLYNGK